MDYAVSPFELKALDDAGAIEGLAAGIGDADHGRDTIMPGAFAKTLAARDGRPLPMLHSHDLARPIGVWTELTETAAGLYAKGRFTMAAPDAQAAHALARDGALSGISIGYIPLNPRLDAKGGRTLPEIDLHEASLVSVPMHPRAQIASVKAITGARDIVDLLRERGVSVQQAKAAAGAAWRTINDNPDDADDEFAAFFTNSAARIAAR
jgi:hypothetical protein